MNRIIGIYNRAVTVTLTGVSLATLACGLAIRIEIELAMICLIASGICDLFDGVFARNIHRSEVEKSFGIQIDSIADMACFGITPAVICICSQQRNWIVLLLSVAYVSCSAIRLAFFNIYGTHTQKNGEYYHGLPVTYAALVFPLMQIIGKSCVPLIQEILVCGSLFGLALLFIINVPIRKPRGIWYALFPLLAIIASGVLLWLRFND